MNKYILPLLVTLVMAGCTGGPVAPPQATQTTGLSADCAPSDTSLPVPIQSGGGWMRRDGVHRGILSIGAGELAGSLLILPLVSENGEFEIVIEACLEGEGEFDQDDKYGYDSDLSQPGTFRFTFTKPPYCHDTIQALDIEEFYLEWVKVQADSAEVDGGFVADFNSRDCTGTMHETHFEGSFMTRPGTG